LSCKAARRASYSPRPWGCFRQRVGVHEVHAVFPTPVGVFPAIVPCTSWRGSIPHARGGVSTGAARHRRQCRYSPRPWGCFQAFVQRRHRARVFPTPVGVFLNHTTVSNQHCSIPHARGGVSHLEAMRRVAAWYSPRPWGCFWFESLGKCDKPVFPTPVGVFLMSIPRPKGVSRIPHARGGVSLIFTLRLTLIGYSPRPWGCFWITRGNRGRCTVFPTPVGVFLLFCFHRSYYLRIPHARGGVSPTTVRYDVGRGYSPRPWGCFSRHHAAHANRVVFPTPVGVFLRHRLPPPPTSSIPHARGGVS